jgi:hypothetical protein
VTIHIQPAGNVAEEATKPVQASAALTTDMTFTVPRQIIRSDKP